VDSADWMLDEADDDISQSLLDAKNAMVRVQQKFERKEKAPKKAHAWN
jgi:hypothetical protein